MQNQKHLLFNCATLAAVLYLSSVALMPVQAQTPPSPAPPAQAKEPTRVRFRPPASGAPSVRLTGGSRGNGDDTVALDVLAPDAVGFTTREQPSLFWFQSKAVNARLEVAVLQDNRVEPLCRVVVDRATSAGIQRLNLADQGVKLMPGVEYEWVVALVTDPENRSSDLVASGAIKRVEPDAALKQQLSQAVPEEIPGIYAQAGIWYDALAVLSDQIASRPQDNELREARAQLLKQVRLEGAASADVTPSR